MNKYETPEIKVTVFEVEDVITTSIPGSENDMPFVPASVDFSINDQEYLKL